MRIEGRWLYGLGGVARQSWMAISPPQAVFSLRSHS